MVYLITSNTTELGETINTTGINDPARYNNMLSQTFNIEPNSQIAVESIKITRNGNIQLSSANNQFAVFIGRDLNACGLSLDESYGFPNRANIKGGNETLNTNDLATRIKYGLYDGLGQHPNFVPISAEGLKVELKNGSGEFEGFKYTFSQNLSGATTNIPAVAGQGGWVSSDTLNINAIISASGSGGVKITKSGDEEEQGECSVIGQKYPLNLANGSVVFRYNSSLNGCDSQLNAGTNWEVGLTRATINNYQANGGKSGMPFWCVDDRTYGADFHFFDYSVSNDGDGKLRVFDMSFFSASNEFRSREINYGTLKNASDYVAVKFIAKGDSINIDFIKYNGTSDTIIDCDAGTKLSNTKPIGISNFYLFPKVNMFSEPSASRVMGIDYFDGLNIPTPRYESLSNLSFQYGGRLDSGVANTNALLGNRLDGDLTHQDFWADLYRTDGSGLARDLECRPLFDMSDVADKNRNGLNASGGVDHRISLITSSDRLFNGTDPATEIRGGYTRDCGSQNIMGFENTSTQTFNTYESLTNGNSIAIESKSVPKMISNKSLFIRLPDLPIESFNTGKGGMSKILYHLPRFDNSGNEVGGLYFQPPQRMYIPLNNPNTIRMNNIKVELVNVDETNDDVDVVGQTIICFDIQKM